MRITRARTLLSTTAFTSLLAAAAWAQAPAPERATNVAAASAGAKLVVFSSQHGDYPAARIIDSKPDAWLSSGQAGHPHTFIIELAGDYLISRLSFDNGSIEGQHQGSSVKEVTVSTSIEAEDLGYSEVGSYTLAKAEVGQGFRLATPVRARWIKLTIKSNYGHGSWTVLAEFRAIGVPAPKQTSETEEGFRVTLPAEVLFDVGEAILRPDGQKALSQTLPILLEYPSAKLVVEGHTDSTGTAESNKTLSVARAASVSQWLDANRGSARWSLDSRGAGATKPIESNATPEGRQRNRRVEITILR